LLMLQRAGLATNNQRSTVMAISRRALLKSGAAAAVCAPALVRGAAAAGDPIVIASMYDLSGGLEAAGKPADC